MSHNVKGLVCPESGTQCESSGDSVFSARSKLQYDPKVQSILGTILAEQSCPWPQKVALAAVSLLFISVLVQVPRRMSGE